jgi:hypothetical protein
MRYRYLLLLILLVVFFSCKKDKGTITPPPTIPPVPAVLLKDIVIPNLPSPYYHFEYDLEGKASFVSFASDLTRYNVVYNGNKISEMRNNIIVNKDTLRYSYDNTGKVEAVKYINEGGIVYTILFFTYDGQKLIEVERDKRLAAGFIVDKTMMMTYYPDGNLKDITYHYLPFNGQTEGIFTISFEQYDTKINVDGFGLIHNDFFDHLVLLPGVQLQKNNPGKETLTGNGLTYKVDYTYTYNDRNLPLTKIGDLVITSGTDAGKHIQTNSTFTYY